MDDTDNLELPGPDNYVWRDNGVASYSRFYTGFNIQYNTSSWILSSYLIAGAVMTPIAGRLSDIFGKKKILLIVMAVYSTGILAGGFANSIGFMLAASCTGHWDVYVPNSLWNHQRNPSREKACDRSDNFQFDIFWRRCSGAGGWRNYNSKLWVASYILFNISYSSYTWPGD